jgi:hypothetical protein
MFPWLKQCYGGHSFIENRDVETSVRLLADNTGRGLISAGNRKSLTTIQKKTQFWWEMCGKAVE